MLFVTNDDVYELMTLHPTLYNDITEKKGMLLSVIEPSVRNTSLY